MPNHGQQIKTSDLDQLSHRLRFARAVTHLETTVYEVSGWIQGTTALPTESFDDATGVHVVSFELPTPIPEHTLGPLIGDVLHNFRSALDHLVYELAVSHTGALPQRVEGSTEFPIFVEEPRAEAWERRVGAVAPEARVAIERMQPYQPRSYPVHALAALYGLSNIDKHRRPTLAAFSISSLDIWPTDDSIPLEFFEPGGPGLVEHGMPHVFARYRATTGQKVEVGYGFTYDLAFNEPGVLPAGARVLEVLWGIRAYIESEVFATLEPFLFTDVAQQG